MSATIYDVSKLSGVSIATISRAFSQPEKVRSSTRNKVFEAAEVLQYHPNAIARAMARQRTDRIAFLICKKDATILDEFYAGICEGIMRETNRADYQLLISTSADWRQTGSTAQSKQIEGVILGGAAQAELISELQSQKVSIILVNHEMPGSHIPCVLSDERSGIRQGIDHLAAKGHRRIAMLAGRISPYIIGERYSAFLESMEACGLPINANSIKMCDPTVESATAAAMEMLQQSDRPTAILGANDLSAVGVVKAAARLHLRIPRDLAVVGYDDFDVCTMLEPELTSVHVDCQRMGELSVNLLRALLEGRQDLPQRTIVPCDLRIRQST